MSGDIIDLTMTDPADEQTHSEADLATIYDVMVWHQIPHLPARSLMQLNCERWSVWNPCHTARIIEARRLDNSRDWYFPLICKRWIPAPKPGEIVPPERCWTWSGIWHESADHAHTESVFTLPPMTYLRQDWRFVTFMLFHIAASEGGLLLIWSRREMIPKRRSEAESNVPDTSPPERSTVTESDYWEKHSSHWTRMLVCNPLTKEYRELPAANTEDMGRQAWRLGYYHGVQVRMVVDDEANSYQVMLLLKSFVAVYKSTTNSWNYLQFQKSRPWSRRFHPWVLYSAAVSVGARVYLADVQSDMPHLAHAHPYARFAALRMDPVSDPTPVGTLRLFEVDAVAGTWHVRWQFTLHKFHLPVLNQYPEIIPFDMGVVDNVELVRCMGALFAILPARLHDVVTVEKKQTPHWRNELLNFGTGRRLKRKNRRSFELHDPKEMWMREVGVKYMPLVFYVMKLRSADGVFGDGVDHGVLRIDVPKTRSCRNFPDYIGRKQRMYERTDVHRSGGPIWFKCEARGSVIWVSFEDYLLSYDVVSRQSTTRMIPVGSSTTDSANHVVRLAYRPNFHMKP